MLLFDCRFPITRGKFICILLALTVIGIAVYFIVRPQPDSHVSKAKGEKFVGAVVANGNECAAIGR